MIKKPNRKIQLSRETVRIVSGEQLSAVAGGVISAGPTCTLSDGTGPFPTRGPCGSSIIIFPV